MADNGDKPVPPHRIARLLMVDDSDVKSIVQGFKKIVDRDGNVSSENAVISQEGLDPARPD